MDDYETVKILKECNEKEIKELLIGRKVKVGDSKLILDNGIVLEIQPNEGGGRSGWYSITKLNEVDNAITNVEFVCDEDVANKEYDDTSYKIFVFCEDTRIKLLQVDGADGTGYYGTGYSIIVKQKDIPRKVLKDKLAQLKIEEKKALKGVKGQDRYLLKQIYNAKITVVEDLLRGKK